MLILHGATGVWDELIVVVVGFGVVWLAVKLAGRKRAAGADGEDVRDPFEDEAAPPVAPPRQ